MQYSWMKTRGFIIDQQARDAAITVQAGIADPQSPIPASVVARALVVGLLEKSVFVYYHIIADDVEGTDAVVSEDFCVRSIERASEIWRSQACVYFTPRFAGYVPNHRFLEQAAIGCFAEDARQMAEMYDVDHAPPPINLYFVDLFGRGDACADVSNHRVALPMNSIYTGRSDPENVGFIVAHEIGHIFLNPYGVDTSLNPEHLMFHGETGEPFGGGTGLYRDECVFARRNMAPSFWGPYSDRLCDYMPQLGERP